MMRNLLTDQQNPIKVLLAEDDEDDQFFFSNVLSELPFATELTIVNNGMAAVEKLKCPESQPDIIFLDLNMPKMSGKECLKMIKTNNLYKTIPCVILSTSSSGAEIEETYCAGANLYLLKPNEVSNLLKMVDTVLKIDWKEYITPKRELYFLSERSLQRA
ncbi:response regulator [Emticicia sp. 21SJ11W-3]|uniref:response regulator n=1 Tax=Emticicia sp. 21SJ11W-3 TaxID=2916755 RepID=UPI00209DEFB0|nr:response regulator [Emticicia sp. 21SJ11W-3]UTA68685.1 response regulator [Emticicia sp. 21SJ11W-3]